MVAAPAKLAALAFLVVVAFAGFGACRWLVSVKALVYVAGAPARESSVPSVGCGRPSVRPASRQVEHSKSWGVITTIFELNPAVMEVLDCWKSSRIVVVGDCKTNDTAWRAVESPRLVYLSPDDQALLPYKIAKHIPWNHFGRKSIGFMFAIHHGADLIYDFDDDNSVKCDSVFHQITDESQHLNVDLVRTNHYLHNPYMWFEPTNGQSQSELDVWPRGFPLAWINDVSTFMDNPSVVSQQINRSRIAVYQGLANHDPDVDAIYRMTRKLPVYFQKNTRVVRAVPLGTFSPWNAQAVLFQRNAFWGMMLPITVTGRVSDIWRSYITMCLMWKTGYHVAFTAPFVTQYRNPHLYMQDFYDERDLYDKADDLLGRLAAWQENASFGSLDEAFVDLIRNLTTGPTRFLDPADATLAEAWVADLGTAGYQWPPLVRKNVRVALKSPQVVDGRLDADHNLGQQGQEPPPANPKGAIPARPPGVPAMMPQRSDVLLVLYLAHPSAYPRAQWLNDLYARFFAGVAFYGDSNWCSSRAEHHACHGPPNDKNSVVQGVLAKATNFSWQGSDFSNLRIDSVNITFISMGGGWLMHRAVLHAISKAQRKYSGFLFATDDAILMPWKLDELDFSQFWVPPLFHMVESGHYREIVLSGPHCGLAIAPGRWVRCAITNYSNMSSLVPPQLMPGSKVEWSNPISIEFEPWHAKAALKFCSLMQHHWRLGHSWIEMWQRNAGMRIGDCACLQSAQPDIAYIPSARASDWSVVVEMMDSSGMEFHHVFPTAALGLAPAQDTTTLLSHFERGRFETRVQRHPTWHAHHPVKVASEPGLQSKLTKLFSMKNNR